MYPDDKIVSHAETRAFDFYVVPGLVFLLKRDYRRKDVSSAASFSYYFPKISTVFIRIAFRDYTFP